MTLLPVHIAGGLTAIVAGFVALSALKGGTLHRKGGIIFVYAMMVMSASGAVMAMIRLNRGNVMGGGLTFYMVTTALLTTRPRVAWMDRAVTLLGLAVGSAGYVFGFAALRSANGRLDGYPPPLYFLFGSIALLSVAGDVRMMLTRGLEGRARLVRHLWRMCFAMFIATGSFFLGQAKVFPKPMRIFPLLAVPALLPLVLMLYWLVRVRLARWRAFAFTNPMLRDTIRHSAARPGLLRRDQGHARSSQAGPAHSAADGAWSRDIDAKTVSAASVSSSIAAGHPATEGAGWSSAR